MTALFDVLLAASLVGAALMLTAAVLTEGPTDLPAMPNLLRAATFFRLGLLVLASRLILGGGPGAADAGVIVGAAGALATGHGRLQAGVALAIAAPLACIAISRAAWRIVRAAERLGRAGLPARRLAIETDAAQGRLDRAEAALQRAALETEGRFVGAMARAARLIRLEAIWVLLIAAIDLGAGALIGVHRGLEIEAAIGRIATPMIGLTVIAMASALTASTAAGMAVRWAADDGSPGEPRWSRSGNDDAPTEAARATAVSFDDVRVELGEGVAGWLAGGRLQDRIRALRKGLATQYGFVAPPVRLVDSRRLSPGGYAILIREEEVATGEIRPGRLLAMDPRGGRPGLPGEPVRDPAFGLPACWIPAEDRDAALARGCTVVDAASVVATHLTEVLKERMADLLSYAEVVKRLEEAPPELRRLADDVVPRLVEPALLQRLLQALLRERVSIRDLEAILGALAEAAPRGRSFPGLLEAVRARLAPQIRPHVRRLIEPFRPETAVLADDEAPAAPRVRLAAEV